jgi:hypothetical protein
VTPKRLNNQLHPAPPPSVSTQVARQVDVLDTKLKEEQESSLRALENLLANTGLSAQQGAQLMGSGKGAVP